VAIPRTKISKSKGRKRRTFYKIKDVGLVPCKNCHTPKIPHRVCPVCNHYNGQKVELKITKEEKTEKTKPAKGAKKTETTVENN
jgi:large subunit ribosomal protein L32